MPDFPSESVAFITGAASGIGLAVAKRLVADGIKQITLIDLNTDALTEASNSLTEIDASVTTLRLAVDVGKEEQVEKAVADTVEKFGRIDVCLNAAGIAGKAAGLADLTVGDLDKVLDVNLKGVWLCERAQIKQFLKQEMRDLSTGLPFKTRGSIINVGSLLGLRADVPGLSSYTIAKHGVVGLTKQDAIDYASQGIRVNCFCPGWIMTGIIDIQPETREYYDATIARVPMGRWGQSEEVAYFASFVLSDKASFITGTSLSIDGGLSAH
ncbi:Levodione reductase [Lachnellula occidentalis]|uniref:Levodione reductase n=1 Tax=Lachnellula occidentalis TaxID=215460 RepID=A0A8H8UC86_9HELO|nr:Levodione reductase [Lachnellula occidentalis]